MPFALYPCVRDFHSQVTWFTSNGSFVFSLDPGIGLGETEQNPRVCPTKRRRKTYIRNGYLKTSNCNLTNSSDVIVRSDKKTINNFQCLQVTKPSLILKNLLKKYCVLLPLHRESLRLQFTSLPKNACIKNLQESHTVCLFVDLVTILAAVASVM